MLRSPARQRGSDAAQFQVRHARIDPAERLQLERELVVDAAAIEIHIPISVERSSPAEGEIDVRSYHAVLRGDCLEWSGRGPDASGPLDVVVTVTNRAEALPPEERRRRAAAALAEIAACGGISGIGDAVEWQRDLRRDRPLPGREE